MLNFYDSCDMIKYIIRSAKLGGKYMKATYYSAGYAGKTDSFKVTKKFSFVCAVACANCGHFLSVSWDNDIDTVEIPEKAHQKIKVCPVCGKKTPLKKDLYIVTKKTSNSAAVNLLENQIAQNLENISRKNVGVMISKTATVKDMPVDNSIAKIVNSDIALLKEYILNLISAESAVYFLTERVVALYKNQSRNNQQVAKENIIAEQERRDKAKKIADTNERERKQAIQALKKENTVLKNKIKELKKAISEKDWTADVPTQEISQPRKPKMITVKIPNAPIAPTLKQVGLFNKKKITAENEELMAQYEKELAAYKTSCHKAELVKAENAQRELQYQEEIKAYYAALEAESERIRKEALALKEKAVSDTEEIIKQLKNKIDTNEEKILKIASDVLMSSQEDCAKTSSSPKELQQNAVSIFLDREMREAQNQLKQAVRIRGQLYSYNIIHNKYRNQVALSTIYEYLDTRRCSELVGADGAYNLFESECRSNLIISQLSTVIETLEEIKQTQYLIYSELKQINRNLDKMNKTMEQAVAEIVNLKMEVGQINNYLEEISINTELLKNDNRQIAENTKVTARNTDTIMSDTKKIADHTKKIGDYAAVTAHYTATSAFYARLNAQLTNAMGFMLALK